METGDASAGRPVIILLHGIARHAHTFDHIAPALRARLSTCIALDMRGHGDSAWSPDGAYLVEDYVKDLEALVDQLRLRQVTLLGNSTGGRVAQVFAGLHPDRSASWSSKTSARSVRRTSPTRSRGASSRRRTAGRRKTSSSRSS